MLDAHKKDTTEDAASDAAEYIVRLRRFISSRLISSPAFASFAISDHISLPHLRLHFRLFIDSFSLHFSIDFSPTDATPPLLLRRYASPVFALIYYTRFSFHVIRRCRRAFSLIRERITTGHGTPRAA